MTITNRLHDGLATAGQALAPQAANERPTPALAAAGMAPLSLTPLAPPRTAGSAIASAAAQGDALPAGVPMQHRALFDRTHEALFDLLSRRDFSALPPSWAGVSTRLAQEEAASAAAALYLIAARVSP